MRHIGLADDTSMSCGELAQGEGTLDLVSEVAMLLLGTRVVVSTGSGRQAAHEEKGPAQCLRAFLLWEVSNRTKAWYTFQRFTIICTV